MGFKLSLLYSIFTPENYIFQYSMSYKTYWGYSTLPVLYTNRNLGIQAEYQHTIELNQEIRLSTTIPSDISTSRHFLTLERHRIALEGVLILSLSALQLIAVVLSKESDKKVIRSTNSLNKQSTRFSGYICYLY